MVTIIRIIIIEFKRTIRWISILKNKPKERDNTKMKYINLVSNKL